MTTVKWNNSYSTGIDIIDEQHKKLFDIMNEIYVASENNSDISIIVALFDELHKYTQYHFDEEEAYFSSLSENSIDEHKQQHQYFIDELEKIKQQCLRIGGLSLELLFFLNDWLVEHIQVEDQKYIDQ